MPAPVTYQFEDEVARANAQPIPTDPGTTTQARPVTYQMEQAQPQEETWLHRIGKAVGQAALPVLGGIGGAALGTAAAPFTAGIANPVTGEMAGSAAGEYLNQKLGITDPSTSSIVLAGALPGVGRAVSAGLKAGVRAAPAIRGMLRDVAQSDLGQLLPKAAQDAKAFYQMADQSGKIVPLEIPLTTGNKTTQAIVPHSFREAQGAVDNLKNAINGMESRGERGVEIARQHLADLQKQIEQSFPGYKQAQTGYAQLKDHELLQSFVNKKGPLRAFEQELAQGKVMGPSGTVQNTSSRLKFLSPDQIKTARSILEQLGPEPGDHIFKNLVEGRAVGHLLGALGGGAIGMHEAGWQGATAGAATGLFVPRVLNWMITQGLRHPTTTALLRDAIQNKGLNRPEFWTTLAQVGSKLGMNMLNDPETAQENAQKQAMAQAQAALAQQQQAFQQQQQQQGGQQK